jgi:hypothetical protein
MRFREQKMPAVAIVIMDGRGFGCSDLKGFYLSPMYIEFPACPMRCQGRPYPAMRHILTE